MGNSIGLEPLKIMISEPFYSVEMIDDGKTHTYRVTHASWNYARMLPGVTGTLQVIAKPFLIPWAVKMAMTVVENALWQIHDGKVVLTPEWISDLIKMAKKRHDKIKTDAGDLGTIVHAYIDKIVKGQRFSVTEVPVQAWPALGSFQEWLETQGFTFIAGDTKVASLEHGFGGSLDALALDRNGLIVLLDWKTSNQFSEEYALQVAAYAKGLRETFGIIVDRAIIVRFTKMTEQQWRKEKPRQAYKAFETRELRDWPTSFKAFAHALELSRLMSETHYVGH